MTTSDRSGATIAPRLAKIDVAAATRVVIASDLHLTRRPTGDSLAVAAELASALDSWVGPGLLVLNGDVFDLADEGHHDAVRILDVHPRLASALERFAAGDGRHMLFLCGVTD